MRSISRVNLQRLAHAAKKLDSTASGLGVQVRRSAAVIAHTADHTTLVLYQLVIERLIDAANSAQAARNYVVGYVVCTMFRRCLA